MIPYLERGNYFRSEYANCVKQGVPALYSQGGIDSSVDAQRWGRADSKDCMKISYHKSNGETNPICDAKGTIDDLRLYFSIGDKFSDFSIFPYWRAGNEYRNSQGHALHNTHLELTLDISFQVKPSLCKGH